MMSLEKLFDSKNVPIHTEFILKERLLSLQTAAVSEELANSIEEIRFREKSQDQHSFIKILETGKLDDFSCHIFFQGNGATITKKGLTYNNYYFRFFGSKEEGVNRREVSEIGKNAAGEFYYLNYNESGLGWNASPVDEAMIHEPYKKSIETFTKIFKENLIFI